MYVRRAHTEDSPALSRICLLTGNAGQSAKSQHSVPDMPGFIYALPYVHMPHTAGFVLALSQDNALSQKEGEGEKKEEEERILGYILLTNDTREFEEAMEKEWFPRLREKYPISTVEDADGEKNGLTSQDRHYIKLFHKPDWAPEACVKFSPAHLHINILPEAQRQGWGRKLVDRAVTYLRDEVGLDSVWLGMDPRNKDAALFYERLGFCAIEGSPDNYVGLKFGNWRVER